MQSTQRPVRTCSVEGCQRAYRNRGFCRKHLAERHPELFTTLCSFAGCRNPVRALGLCHSHHTQRSRGIPLRPLRKLHAPIPIEERMVAYTDRSADCWIWNGARSDTGYGHVLVDGRMRGAHRVAYELANGPVPHGLVIDHLCRNRACVRPEHLEAVTQRENVMRGISPAARAAASETCARGHQYTEENTRMKPGRKHRPVRECRTCRREYRAERRAKGLLT